MTRQYFVYILASPSRTLYTGVTNDLETRFSQHRQASTPGFPRRYNVRRLVSYEQTPDVQAALAREKQIKGWSRAKKIALIESVNPGWKDIGAM